MAKIATIGAPNSGYTLNTVCPSCGKDLKGKRPQAKFCSPHCRFDFHNAERRKREIESPPPAATGKAGSNQTKQVCATHHSKTIRPNTKLASVLAYLARGNSLNRFQAERTCHDHCLHSTIAEIQKRGISVDRKDETVPGFGGKATHVCRYWLADEEKVKAAKLLGWNQWQEHANG